MLSEGTNSENVFCGVLVEEGREDPNTTISGPPSARQRYAIEKAFRWRADMAFRVRAQNGPTLILAW